MTCIAYLIHRTLMTACDANGSHSHKKGAFTSVVIASRDVLSCLDELIHSTATSFIEQEIFRIAKRCLAHLMSDGEYYNTFPEAAASVALCFLLNGVFQQDEEDGGEWMKRNLTVENALELLVNVPKIVIRMANNIVVKAVERCGYQYWDRDIRGGEHLRVWFALNHLTYSRIVPVEHAQVFKRARDEVCTLWLLAACNPDTTIANPRCLPNRVQAWLLPLTEVFRDDAMRRGYNQAFWLEIAMLQSLG